MQQTSKKGARTHLAFELPFPPSLNHYWRHVGPRVLISRAGRQFREQVRGVLLAAHIQPLEGRLLIRLQLCPPDRRRRDLDNSFKALLDALQHGGAYKDDSQIMKLIAEKCAPVKGGQVLVQIETLEEEPDV